MPTLKTLAKAVGNQDLHTEAEDFLRQALEITREKSGSRQESIQILDQLARGTSYLGAHNEAEDLIRQKLDLEEETLGRTHEQTISSLKHFADYLTSQGKIGEAKHVQQQARERNRERER